MSIWTRIADAISALAQGEGLSHVFDRMRTPPERTAAFAIAVIALGAKMAKADGLVTRDEVTAFREVFTIPESEEKNAARVFNLARQDVAGYEEYASKIKSLLGDDCPSMQDLIEGLFHIAIADGEYHPNEDQFLLHVAEIMGFSERGFKSIRARFVPEAERDPHDVLGVDPDMPMSEIKQAYRAAVRSSHPDQMMARGVPKEAIKLAEKRLIDINQAWEQISAQNAQHAS